MLDTSLIVKQSECEILFNYVILQERHHLSREKENGNIEFQNLSKKESV